MQIIIGKMLKKPRTNSWSVLLRRQIQFVGKESAQRNKASSLRKHRTKWKKGDKNVPKIKEA